ncbi:long-chain fatty acid--CoA ligase [candidate division KSB1 bacterium]|nr:long-chain fatty acid--CoA ligase [candidate division KSB1 bacterium]
MKFKKEIFALPKMAKHGFLAFKEKLIHKSVLAEKPWLSHYDAGVPYELQIPEIPLYQLLQHAFSEAGDKTALIYYHSRFTYHHLYGLVTRFAAGLKEIGVQKGDRVAICLPNIPQFLIAYWAASYIGAVVVLINPLLSERELRYQLSNSRSKVLVVLDRIYPRVHRIKAQTQLEHIVIAMLETYMPPFLKIAFQFQQRIQKTREKIERSSHIMFFRHLLRYPPLTAAVPVASKDPAVLIYTGGVTGTPKAATLSHANVVANALQARAWLSDLRDGREIILAVLPFNHSYGMTACHHLGILTRSMMIMHPRFDVKQILRSLKRYNVSLFPGVPTMFSSLLTEVRRKPTDLSHVRYCISGGAPLSADLKRDFEAVTHGKLVEGYGLTEASPITHCNPLAGVNKTGCIGLPWPNTEARIVDMNTGAVLKANTLGELQIRGPQVMLGYWDAENTADQVIDADGWLSSGDIGYCDSEGYFFIVDRKKDIIFCGGYNIYPSEVEKVLLEHPDVGEAAVVPMPDAYYGEVVKAFIVPRNSGKGLQQEALINFCKGKLAKYKIPRHIEFRAEFPRNLLGKVLKREL